MPGAGMLQAIFYWILIARQILWKISKMQRGQAKSLRRQISLNSFSIMGSRLQTLSPMQMQSSERPRSWNGGRAAKYHASVKTLSPSQDVHLSDRHLSELQEVFSLFDVNNDKTMDMQELKVQ